MKRSLGPVFGALRLDPSSRTPLYRQLYDSLREALISGTIPAGSRLPSTRALAEDLGLSRNTVAAAFDRLLEEGFIESRVGDGSYASDALEEEPYLDRPVLPPDPLTSRMTEGQRSLSRRGEGIAHSVLARDPSVPVAFSVGVPALDAFPLKTWQRIVARRVRQSTSASLSHGSSQGDPRLRELIARHLATARDMRCSPEQIVILPSAQLGLDLASRVLLDPGDAAWIENPGYLAARGALRAAGARLVPVPVDDEGLRVKEGRALSPHARLAYVTPSHQFPLGASMSLRRRLQLLAWADEARAWIIEDDYDSEFRYTGASPQALQGLDRSGRVLYLGTFTKSLFPALRLAYLVLPADLVQPMLSARFLADGHVPPIMQLALADFIEAGHLVGHLRRMRGLYRERRDVFLAEATKRFGDHLEFSGIEAGMHVSARLAEGDDHALADAAAEHGIHLSPLSRCYLGNQAAQGIYFGYSHIEPREIVRACAVVGEILTNQPN